MSQNTIPTFKRPPSRRGTPATNDPIPYFNSQANAGSAATDFFSSFASAQPANAPAIHQQLYQGAQMYQQQQQLQVAPVQPSTNYQQFQQYQPQPLQPPPREIPPRSATGPAIDYPQQGYGYGYTSHATSHANAATDPYRSASVVHGGMQYGAQYGYQQPAAFGPTVAATAPVEAADFFDQLAGSPAQVEAQGQGQAHAPAPAPAIVLAQSMPAYSQAQTGPALDIYQQPTTYSTETYAAQYTNHATQALAATSDGTYYGYNATATNAYAEPVADINAPAAQTEGEADAANGVVYDESSGQYYDTKTGQYYDDASGTWYYPQPPLQFDASAAYTPATVDAAVVTTAPAASEPAQLTTQLVVPVFEPVTAPEATVPASTQEFDGEAFFDEIGVAAVNDSQTLAAVISTTTAPSAQPEGAHEIAAVQCQQLTKVSQTLAPAGSQGSIVMAPGIASQLQPVLEQHQGLDQEPLTPSAVDTRPADTTGVPINLANAVSPNIATAIAATAHGSLSDNAFAAPTTHTPSGHPDSTCDVTVADASANASVAANEALAGNIVEEPALDHQDSACGAEHGLTDPNTETSSTVNAHTPTHNAALGQNRTTSMSFSADAEVEVDSEVDGVTAIDTGSEAFFARGHDSEHTFVESTAAPQLSQAEEAPLVAMEQQTHDVYSQLQSEQLQSAGENLYEYTSGVQPQLSAASQAFTEFNSGFDQHTGHTATTFPVGDIVDQAQDYTHEEAASDSQPLDSEYLVASQASLPATFSTSADWSQQTVHDSASSYLERSASTTVAPATPGVAQASTAILEAAAAVAAVLPDSTETGYADPAVFYGQEYQQYQDPQVSSVTAIHEYAFSDAQPDQQYSTHGFAEDTTSNAEAVTDGTLGTSVHLQHAAEVAAYADDSVSGNYGLYGGSYSAGDAHTGTAATVPVDSGENDTATSMYGYGYNGILANEQQQHQDSYWQQEYPQQEYPQQEHLQQEYPQQEYPQQDQQQQQQQDYYQQQQEYPANSYSHYAPVVGAGHHEPATALPGIYNMAPVAVPGMTLAPMSDIAQSSYRAASSMSGFMIPPPATAATFDLHSQSERTSTDMAYYERDSSSMSHGQQQLQQDVGIHDPLGRLSACRPIISFGFGGKLVTMLPRNVQRFNIYDSGKASKIAPGMLQIQQLSAQISPDLCGQEALSLANVPLLAGETTRAALLKRRDAAVACANAWLESSRLSPSNTLTQEEEALYRVIIAILGTFDQADVPQQPVILGALDALRPLFGKSGRGATKHSDFAEPSLPISHGSKQQLENLESLLLAGNRKEAVDTACSQGLWTHALIIASCTGKDLWQSVISAYTECVLGGELSTLGTQYRMFSGLGAGALDEPRSFDKRNQSAPNDEFVAAADIGGGGGGSSSISYSGKAEQQQQHASANGDLTQTSVGSEDKTSDNWAKVLSLMLANRTPGDQAAIMALGDRLRKNGRTVEAHICYVLTQQGKDIFMAEGADTEPRAIILGVAETTCTHGNRNHAFDMAVTRYSRYYRKHSAMFATELYELVFALRAVSAGDSQSAGSTATSSASTAAATGLASGNGPKQPTLLCLPHLQAYKLYYAWWLVDCGQTALASRYCDAVLNILATLPQGTAVPFINNSLVQELRNLRERLSGAGMMSTKAAEIVGDDAVLAGASSKSWLSRAMPRPSFTSLMTVFDSSIEKFITGADGNRIPLETNATPGKFEIGPDRQSAQPNCDAEHQPNHPARPLGAVTWNGRTPSPHVTSSSVLADSYAHSYGSPRQSLDGRPSFSGISRQDSSTEPPRMFTPSNFASQTDYAAPGYANFANYATQPDHHQQQQPPQQPPHPPQWGDPGFVSRNAGQGGFITPNASFVPAAAAPLAGSRGPSFDMGYGGSGAIESSSAPPAAHVHSGYSGQYWAAQSGGSVAVANHSYGSADPGAGAGNTNGDDDEDMFGFSKGKKQVPAASAQPAQTTQGAPRVSTEAARSSAPSARASTDAKDEKAAGKGDGEGDDKASSGVFGMFKSLWGGRKNQANLGEESHFVYDPVLERWVDRNAAGDQQDSGPPPPPPPSMMKFQPQSSSVPPPASAGVSYPQALTNMQYGSSIPSASTPLGGRNSVPPPPAFNGMTPQPAFNGMTPQPAIGSMVGRPTSTVYSATGGNFSRTGTPVSIFESTSATGGMVPPALGSIAGARQQARRRGARSKYVDVAGQLGDTKS
ncbi:hypothetical protein LPJ66_007441 [Kickxella alabastrina]|uniref:Uncharacterized protein n=1 Tax=Kickxella alabastrina TaxID=61397 RepID=A0ACC1ICU7_9FUNG|nr:hypothetical protein LPJ66_007441 [Kickxella alabastrina]